MYKKRIFEMFIFNGVNLQLILLQYLSSHAQLLF